MSEISQLITIGVGLITIAGTFGGVMLWLLKPRIVQAIQAEVKAGMQPMQLQVAETHKQVTQNHHSNERPTVLDRIDDVHTDVQALRQEFVDHVLLSGQTQGALARSQEQTADRMTQLEASLSTMAEAQPALYAALEAIAKSAPPPDI